ncbi:hypothetical protein KQI88_10360 [Alkaliphilus sp. MSJ-5]|uniref:Uncharacterized protein n=1 Tax=Alkaliphilus flagellatus TaxID=2841507 RepID=A0ABS6G2V4_9FIRM|nr:hypothetical protein [Alkaliphilus flagellatus]MBU5676821.1 hypothetical protein [Alkaliphilus flagellatus]
MILILLWLFKEVRITYLKDRDFEIARIEQVLKVYGDLEVKILRYLENEKKESQYSLQQTISASYSFLSREIFKNVKIITIVIIRAN